MVCQGRLVGLNHLGMFNIINIDCIDIYFIYNCLTHDVGIKSPDDHVLLLST